MKKLISLFIFLYWMSGTSGQAPVDKLTISHLTGDFYIYVTNGMYKGEPVPANSMYVVTEEGVVLFDTPWDSTQFQPLLDSIKIRHNKNVVMCISTHSHKDRTAGLEYYRRLGIKTYTTKLTDDISKINNEKRAEFLIYKDTVFTISNHTFQTYYAGPGHTTDNIVIWFDREKILYGGCLVKSTDATDLGYIAEANVNQWTATIRNIQRKFAGPAYVIPGHGDWQNKESLAHTVELIRLYREKK